MKRQIWYMLILSAAFLLTSCVRLEVATPDKPVNINMNVKIEHEIKIKVDRPG